MMHRFGLMTVVVKLIHHVVHCKVLNMILHVLAYSCRRATAAARIGVVQKRVACTESSLMISALLLPRIRVIILRLSARPTPVLTQMLVRSLVWALTLLRAVTRWRQWSVTTTGRIRS